MELQVAVSSASCGEFRPNKILDVVVPSRATAETVRRVEVFHHKLAPFFGSGNVGVSLHTGFTTDVYLAGSLYGEAGIAISSLDIPDIVPVTEIALNVFKDGFAGNLGLVQKHIGWGLQNVPSQSDYKAKINQGLEVLANNPTPHIIRANAKIFLESQAGEVLRRRLRYLDDHILAIEIDADRQTPADYLQFLQILNLNRHIGDAPVAADLDLGHLGRSRFLHRRDSDVPQPLAVLKCILANRPLAKLLGLVSLNQYQEGEGRTHENFLGGSIDFSDVTFMLGLASRNNLLPYPPMVMAEFYPMEYSAMLSDQGLKIWSKMAQAYYQ